MIRNRKALKKASKKGFSTSPKSIHSTNDSTWKHMVSPLILTFARPDFEQVLQHDQERALNPITTTLCKGRSAVDDKWCWQNLSHWEGVENRIDTGEREYVQAMVFPRIWYPRRSLPSLSTFVHYDIGISSIQRIISKLNLWTYLSILNTTSRKHILFEQIPKISRRNGVASLPWHFWTVSPCTNSPTDSVLHSVVVHPQNKGSIIRKLPMIFLFSSSKRTEVNRLSLSVQRIAFKYPSRLVWFFFNLHLLDGSRRLHHTLGAWIEPWNCALPSQYG